MYKYGLAILILIIVSSCDKYRVFEKNIDLKESKWNADSIITFEFKTSDSSQVYNLYVNVRNNFSYKYSNLYIKYFVLDKKGNVEITNMAELFLMDDKTGKPLGKGNGDVFEHQFQLLKNHKFASKGPYYVKIKQYMRDQVMDGVYSVGLRVEKNAQN